MIPRSTRTIQSWIELSRIHPMQNTGYNFKHQFTTCSFHSSSILHRAHTYIQHGFTVNISRTMRKPTGGAGPRRDGVLLARWRLPTWAWILCTLRIRRCLCRLRDNLRFSRRCCDLIQWLTVAARSRSLRWKLHQQSWVGRPEREAPHVDQ